MLEDKVAFILQKYLGNYVRGLSKEALKISVWKGDVELKNMQLRPEALNELNLPLKVRSGFLGSIKLKVPWSRLGQEPVLVYFDRIFLLVEPATNVEPLSQDSFHENKKNKIKEMEIKLLESIQGKDEEENSSWLGSLIHTIIGNIKLSITNIHIRFEDSESHPGHPFAVGITLDKLAAVTVDDQGCETFVTGGALEHMQKSLDLERLALYFDSDSNPWGIDKLWEDLSPSEWNEIFGPGIKGKKVEGKIKSSHEHCYILHPVSGHATYAKLGYKDSKIADHPAQKAVIDLDDVTLCLSQPEYQDILKLAENISTFNKRMKYSHYRPFRGIKEDAKSWWQYACKVLTEQEKKASGHLSWEQIMRYARLRKRYVSSYVSCLQAEPERLVIDDIKEIEDMDRELDLEVILQWRMLAHNYVKKSTENDSLYRKKQLQKSWWPFGSTATQSDKEDDDGRVRILTAEEWEQINKLIGYKDDTGDSFLPLQGKMNVPHTLLEVHMRHNASKLIDANVIVELSSEGLQCCVKMYPVTKEFDLKLNSYQLNSPNGLLVESATKDDSLKATFSYMPFDQAADWSLSAKASPCYITYLKETVDQVSKFFSSTSTFSQTLALETAAAVQMTFNQVKRSAQLQLSRALKEHSRFYLNLDIAAPKVTIPTGFYPDGIHETNLLLDLGYFTLDTEEVNDWEDPEEKDIYIQFRLVLKEVSAFLVDGSYDWSLKPSKQGETALQVKNCLLPVLDECGILVALQQIRVPHPLYPETRVAVRLPSLGFHLSPSRYHRIMQVAKLFQNEIAESIQPWDSADFGGSLSVLSWKGVGGREAVWQHRYVALVGPFLYILESEEPKTHKQRVSLYGKQILNIPAENIGNVENVLAICDAGQYNSSKIAESANTLILRCEDENSRRNWQTRLQGAIYKASASTAVTILDDFQSSADRDQAKENTIISGNRMKLFLKGVLDELKVTFSSNFQAKQNLENILLAKERRFLELRALGSKVEFAITKYDMRVGALLETLEIEDALTSNQRQQREFLARSFIETSSQGTRVKPQNFAKKELITLEADKGMERSEFYFDTSDDIVATKEPYEFETHRQQSESNLEYFDAESSLPIDKNICELPTFKKTPGLLPDPECTPKDISAEPMQELKSFVSASIIIYNQDSPSYTNVDNQAMLSLATLSFYFNRPTILEIMNFISAISIENVEEKHESKDDSSLKIGDLNVENDITFKYERNESMVKGLLGRGKERVICSLLLNMARARLFLNNENGTQLACLSQDNLRVGIKVFPSSFGISASLGNLRISDTSLDDTHPYHWICDMRDPHGSSFVQLDFVSFSPEDDDYEGYEYSLCGELSEVRIVYLNRFVQEVLAYFMGLVPKHTGQSIKIKDQFSNSERWFTESEIVGSPALRVDLSLKKPILLMPRRTDSTDFLELDVVHVTVTNCFEWIGGNKSEPSAVRMETMSVMVQDINLMVGMSGRPGERIIEGVNGLSLVLKRSLRDLWHQIPVIEASVKINGLRASLSDKEYQVITECASSNMSEEANTPPPFNAAIECLSDVEIIEEHDWVDSSGEGHSVSVDVWVSLKVTIEIRVVELGLYRGSARDAPLATIQILGAWLLYKSCSNGDDLVMATLRCFSVTDDRLGTEKEFKHAIGKASNIEYLPFDWAGDDKVLVQEKKHRLREDLKEESATMLMVDVKLSKSTQHISISIQRPQLLVALDFLLAIAEFFVPSLPGSISGGREERSIDFEKAIILNQPIYHQNEDVVTLSYTQPLIVDDDKYDEFVYDGNGGQIWLVNRDEKVLTEASKEPIIFIASGKRLYFKNVVILNGKFLDSCIFMGSNSSYSAHVHDGVFIMERVSESGNDGLTEHSNNALPEVTTNQKSSSDMVMVIELQAIGPEFTFYTVAEGDKTSSKPSEKLLHAEVDILSRLKITEDTTELNASVLGLTIEASSGVRVVEPFDTIISFSNISGKNNIHIIISELFVNFSYSILKLFMRIEEDITNFLHMTSKQPIVECYQFNKIWTNPDDSSKQKYTFWRPRAPRGFAILGDCLTPTEEPPSKGVIALNTNYAKVKRPIRFEPVWSSSVYGYLSTEPQQASHKADTTATEYNEISESGLSGEEGCTVWMPIAPEGYVSLGCIVTRGRQLPSEFSALCVSRTLLTPCPYHDCIFINNLLSTYENAHYGFWRVDNSLGSFLPLQSDICQSLWKPYDLRQVMFATNSEGSGQTIEESMQNKNITSNEDNRHMKMSSLLPLELTFVDVNQFELVWSNQGTEAKKMLSVWRPIIPPGCIYVGDIAVQGYDPPPHSVVLQDPNNELAFKKPLNFQKVGAIKKTRKTDAVSFWFPEPAPGYVSLGCVASKSLSKPDGIGLLRCVRSDLVIRHHFYDARFWDSNELGSTLKSFSIWSLDDELGTFFVWKESRRPPRRFAVSLSSQKRDEQYDIVIDTKVQRLSATLFDDFGGMMAPLLNFAAASIRFASFGVHNKMCSALRLSMLAKMFNEKRSSWEPLIELVDGWIGYEYTNSLSGTSSQIHVTLTKEFNMNLSVCNINMLLEAIASWNRVGDFKCSPGQSDEHLEEGPKSVFNKASSYIIPQNKLGCDVFIRITEFGGESEVISLPPGDVVTVKVPASENILGPDSKENIRKTLSKYVAIVISDAEFPKQDTLETLNSEYMVTVKVVPPFVSSDEYKSEIQALHTRCMRPALESTALRVHWNEVFYIKLDDEGNRSVEISVTDPVKDTCIGSYSYPLARAVSLRKKGSDVSCSTELCLQWENLCSAESSSEGNKFNEFVGKIRCGVFISSILNDKIYSRAFSSDIKLGVIEISPAKNGPWTTVNLAYSASVACWKMGQNLIAGEVFPQENNKYLILRSLVSVINQTDFLIELCLFPELQYQRQQNITDQKKEHEPEDGSDVAQDEIFENEKYHPVLGWGSSYPGHLSSSDPGRWTNRENSYSSQHFPDVHLSPGWEWTSDWHVDLSASRDGWTYGTNFENLKCPPQFDPEGPNTTARRRRWIRTRCRIPNDGCRPFSLGQLKPGDSIVLPIECQNHGTEYYLRFRPVNTNEADAYSWSYVVPYKADHRKASGDKMHHTDISSLNESEELICSPQKDTLKLHKEHLWFSLCVKGYEIGKDASMDSIRDWKLFLTAPLILNSFLSVPSEFVIFEKLPDGKMSVCVRSIIKSGETKKIYDADLRKPLYFSLIPQGGWEPLQETLLIHHPKRRISQCYSLRSVYSGRIIQVMLDFNKEENDAIAKTLRIYTQYWLECLGCPPLQLRFINIEQGRLFLTKKQNTDGEIFEAVTHEEMQGGVTMLSILNLKSVSLAIALPDFGDSCFDNSVMLSSLADLDGAVYLKARGPNNQSMSLFVSTKPCPYQSAPTKVMCIRPYMRFTNRTGQRLYIKFNTVDDEKVLQPSDSGVAFCMTHTEETEKLLVRLDDTMWSHPLEFKEDTIFISMQNVDGSKFYLCADVRGYQEGSRFLIIFRLGSENGPFRFENRSRVKAIKFRQTGFHDQAWQLLRPLSTTNYAWEDPFAQQLLEVIVEHEESSFFFIIDINVNVDTYPYHGIYLSVFDHHDIKVVKFFDNEERDGIIGKFEENQYERNHVVSVSQTERGSQSKTTPLEFILDIGIFGLSVIDQRPQEILYLYLENLFVSYSTCHNNNESRLKILLGYLQLDNQLPLTSMPVLLSPEIPIDILQPVVKIVFTMSNDNAAGTQTYPYVGIQVTENCWRLNVHEPVIWALMDFQKNINFPGLAENSNVSHVDPEIRINKIYVSEVRLRVSLETAPMQRPHGIFGFWTPIITTIGNVAKMQIHFRKVDRRSKFMRKSSVMPAIINQIWKDLIHNPFHLLSGVNVLGMTSSTLATISKGFAKLSTDGQFLMLRFKQDRSRRIMGVGDGILHGSEALAQGVAFGISGVVTKPLSSAREQGVKGLLQGIGRAFLGFVVQPVSGALDFASLTVHGIGATCSRFFEIFEAGTVSKRIRLPRAFRANGVLDDYNARAAFGQMVLHLAESSRHFGCTEIFKEPSKFAWSDFYEEHFDLHHGWILLLTSKRSLMVHCNKNTTKPGKIAWDVPWDRILAVEVIKGGSQQASHVILHLKSFRRSEAFVRIIRYKGENMEDSVNQITAIHSCIQRLWRTHHPSKTMSDSEVSSHYSASSISRNEVLFNVRTAESCSSSYDSSRDKSSNISLASLQKFREHAVTFERIWTSEQDPRSPCVICPPMVSEERELCSIWRPSCPEGYVSVGDIAYLGKHQPSVAAVYKYNNTDFAPPVGFELVWRNCADDYVSPLSIWIPVAPEGFMAVGCVAVAAYAEPEINICFCVSLRLVEETTFEEEPLWACPNKYPWACYIYQVRSEALQFIAMRRRKELTTWRPFKVLGNSEDRSF